MKIPEAKNLFLGFDPGGKGKFGWIICHEVGGSLQSRPTTGLADNAWDAMTQVEDALVQLDPHCDSPVLAAGIDAPLMWDERGDKQGRRKVDDILSDALKDNGLKGNPVLALNSLYGSVVVQGSLLARRLSATWDLVISESHPTVLKRLLRLMESPEWRMAQELTIGLNDHKKDATLSAISAWAAIRKPAQWQNLYDQDARLFNPCGIPVTYWMPIP